MAARARRWWWPSVAVLLAAHLALRGWAAYGAFWYLDDYRLVREGGDRPLASRLLEPYDAQFMPLGRALAWLAARADPADYRILATMSLAMAAAAACSCLWMLVTLFGRRPGVLAVWALYLSTAITAPAYLWWAAGLNQMPLQSVFFLAVGAWVRHLRGDGRRWLTVLAAVLTIGLGSYVKTLLVFPVLAFVTVAYFSRGGPVVRLADVLRRHWAATAAGVLGAGGYLVYYVTTAPQLATVRRPGVAGDLAREMLGTTFAPGLLGGPWRWDDVIAPVAQADPPPAAAVGSWLVLAGGAVVLGRLRRRTGRAWFLLGSYVAADYLLLLTTRAQVVGAVTGTEYRYLTDAACAAVLALGLATMELPGAAESSEARFPRGRTDARARPRSTGSRRPTAVAVTAATAVVAAVTIGGVSSTVTYARSWHSGHPGKTYLEATLADLDAARASSGGAPVRIDLEDQVLPQRVTGALNLRDSSSRRLLSLLSDVARFPPATERPHRLDDSGRVVAADIDPSATTGRGPQPGCGWRLQAPGGVRLALDRPLVDRGWWVRIDYLAADDSALDVEAGRSTRVVDLRRGLHRLFVAVDGGFDAIGLGGTDPGVTVCVDQVQVGLLATAAGDDTPGPDGSQEGPTP